MKIKKYTDPRIKAEALARSITKLGEAAAVSRKASSELKEATENALKKMGRMGLEGTAATSIIAVICSPLYTCHRCGRDRLERDMEGSHCIECAAALRRAEVAKQQFA